MRASTLRRTLGLLPLLVLLAGCGEEAEQGPDVAQPEYEGLSRDQIQNQAESMTPEEAERLGIVDTTIRLQPPMNPDSVVPLDAPVVPLDSAR